MFVFNALLGHFCDKNTEISDGDPNLASFHCLFFEINKFINYF